MGIGLIEEFEFFTRNELNPKKEIEANIVSYAHFTVCYKVHTVCLSPIDHYHIMQNKSLLIDIVVASIIIVLYVCMWNGYQKITRW